MGIWGYGDMGGDVGFVVEGVVVGGDCKSPFHIRGARVGLQVAGCKGLTF